MARYEKLRGPGTCDTPESQAPQTNDLKDEEGNNISKPMIMTSKLIMRVMVI